MSKKRPDKIVPLCSAVLDGDYESFIHLIEQGVDVDEKDYNGLTALGYASRDGKYEMLKILVKHGADLEVRDPYGNTPLSEAVY